MNKITSIEQRVDKNQNPMKVVTFEGADKVVYVNSKYDSNYDSVVVGAEFELEVDGNFLKIKGDKPSGGSRSGMMTKVMNEKRENIAHAMDKKAEAIKLASTARMATDMVVATMFSITGERADNFSEEMVQKQWHKWRAYFYVNWNEIKNELVEPF